MIYQCWHGVPARVADEEPDDILDFAGPPYGLAYTEKMTGVESIGHDRLLGYVWRVHNRDDRPKWRKIRSLSTGDVVVILNDDREFLGAYRAARFGWDEVSREDWEAMTKLDTAQDVYEEAKVRYAAYERDVRARAEDAEKVN